MNPETDTWSAVYWDASAAFIFALAFAALWVILP